MLKKLFLAGAATIEADKDRINELNVFPVPDGDTGTNMTLTIISAAKDVAEIEDVNFETLCKTMSSGSLRGARGNSGVILSQLLRGFTKEVKTCTEITVPVAV
ncbi:MAG TPA: dihydroxyacetone kinase, partial [Lachnospiraceae bacterium]|nr:dihydroxyacetone kinase [Lachnospiraceae bacterium]